MINIEEILTKHRKSFNDIRDQSSAIGISALNCTFLDEKAAIKEIVEKVIDLCAKEAKSKDLTRPNCDDHTLLNLE